MQYGQSQIGNIEYGGMVSTVPVAGLETIDGVAKIKVTLVQNINGRSNIYFPPVHVNNIYGTANIVFSPLKNISGQARIKKTEYRYLYGTSKILINQLKTISGVAYIHTGTAVFQTINGVGKISATIPKTINGRSRITFPGTDWNPVSKPNAAAWHQITNQNRTTSIWNPVDKSIYNH